MSYQVFPIEFASDYYDEYIALRSRILREPLGLSFSVEDLSREYDMFHFGVYNDDNLIACFVLVDLGEAIVKMRQVAVVEDHQNKGLGTLMVNYCETWCKLNNYKKIVLNARTTAVRFYEKNNYTKVGKEFEEVGIPHFKMQKEL